MMGEKIKLPRRSFLKQAAVVLGASAQVGRIPSLAKSHERVPTASVKGHGEIEYPRVFSGPQLKMLSFPLGGVGAGSLGLGGRGQLRDWEIFNRPNQGFSPPYAFPAIWAQSGNDKPIARVLESRILPPYQGQEGLASNNVPGLSRLESARFAGEYPLAHVDFEDSTLPVTVELDAFSPFIPHEPDDSGLPVAILRYRVTNHRMVSAKVGIVFSIDNPITIGGFQHHSNPVYDKRTNEHKTGSNLSGILMGNPELASDHPMAGTFALCCIQAEGVSQTHWQGWPRSRWWNSPMLFWDAFSEKGELNGDPNPPSTVAAVCQKRTIAPGGSGTFTFVLAWNFPNRTPEWCGWDAPEGKEKTIIGNHYATRFKDAWEVAQYTTNKLENLEARTRMFARAIRESTVSAVVKEAATANLSTLASTTCFRAADGEFRGFEGSYDTTGVGSGNCLHVWNYETATAFLFPSFARSLRKTSFGYPMDDEGGMRFRQLLPDGFKRFGFVAADGQMGQVMHAYLDWKLSGDNEWGRAMWPQIQKAMAFAWQPGGWDPDRKGVLSGVQHNTYDVEFFGPNPLCGIYYLGALRACEEMAHAFNDNAAAAQYTQLFNQGRQWIDANLFNGQFYIQKIIGYRKSEIARNLQSNMGSENTETPEYQVGQGCLIDQLMGQYLAEVSGLGPLVASDNIRATLKSIYRFNYKRSLVHHNSVERTFALNDEAAMVVCDYGNAPRPRIPFPYYAEVMTGLEHAASALMISYGMVDEGVECIGNIRARYDGEKRNPWDEAEYGHHYARAMASWSSLVAISGFGYDGASAAIVAKPPRLHGNFKCFWATATGWGTFSYTKPDAHRTLFTLEVLSGILPCRSCQLKAIGSTAIVRIKDQAIKHTLVRQNDLCNLQLTQSVLLREGTSLLIAISV